MVVLGIDPGLTVTGFAVIAKQGSCTLLLDHGYLSLPASKTIAERIGLFYTFFSQKVACFQVSRIALETPFLGKNTQSFLKLGYLRGIIYLIGNQSNIIVHDFAPREVKQMVTGYGGASKEQVARAIAQFFPSLRVAQAKPLKADVTDACAIALCGYWSLSHNPAFLK